MAHTNIRSYIKGSPPKDERAQATALAFLTCSPEEQATVQQSVDKLMGIRNMGVYTALEVVFALSAFLKGDALRLEA